MTSPYPTRTDLEDQAAIEIGAAGSLRAAGKAQRPRQWQRGPIAAASSWRTPPSQPRASARSPCVGVRHEMAVIRGQNFVVVG